MAAVEPTVIDEVAEIAALIDTTTKKQKKDERVAPRGFAPSAVFLLDLAWHNLFERADRDGLVYRCKGCTALLRFTDRERHFKAHKRSRDTLAKQPTSTYRDTDKSKSESDIPSDNRKKENEMTSTTAKPKVKKTEVARNAAMAALKQIGRQATMSEIVEIASKDSKVKSADVPDSTISAQVNFELAEKSPRIVRVSRGVYALKGNEKKPLPETATVRTGSRSTTGSSSKAASKSKSKTKAASKSKTKSASKGRSSARSSVQVTPHPKPGRA